MEPIHQGEHRPIEGSKRQRCASGAKLGGIFSHGHIAAMMGAIFDVPMGSLEFQKPVRASLLGRQAGDPIHDLLRTLEWVSDAPTNEEDLSRSCPLPPKERIEQGRRPDASFFQAAMSLVPGVLGLPFVCLGLRVAKKGMNVLSERGMILFDNQDVVASKTDHIGTKGALGVQRIRRHNPIFDQMGLSQPGSVLISLCFSSTAR